MSRRRIVLSTLASAALAVGVLAALPAAPASAANDDVVINEVESQDGFPDDWVELYNTGASSVDISGWVLKDSTNNVRGGPIPAATTLAAGGYYVIEAGSLGDNDQARIFVTDGGAQVGTTYSWTTPAHGTYSRCANGIGGFVDTTPSKGTANVCDTRAAWPGGTTVTVADGVNTFTNALANNPAGDDVSGLAYVGGSLYAVQNTHGTLYKLNKSGSTWAPDASFGSGGAKALHYPGGLGEPDTEGMTLTDAGVAGGFFVSTERDATNSSVSRPSILQFQDAAGSSLSATHEWALAADLGLDIPVLDPNQALEGIAWVPDSYLTAHAFKDQATNATYNPATYANHGSGLFFVGVEQTGNVYAYALDLTSSSYTRVAKFASGFPSVMDLNYEPGTQKLWVVCDDTCGGRTTTFQVDGTGAFAPTGSFERPSAADNLNNEGFAIAPQSECVNGKKPTFYADDSNDAGHVIRTGTLNCQLPTISGSPTSSKAKTASGWYGAPVTVSFTCAAGSLPLSGACPSAVALQASGANQTVSRSVTDAGGTSATATVSGINIDLVAPTVKVKGVKKGKTYTSKQKPKCVGSDALSGIGSCTVTQKKKGSKYTVTATATDKAGNVTKATLTYKVKKK